MKNKFQIVSIAVCLLALGLIGGQMYSLYQKQALWAWLPLPFLLAFWGLIVCLRLPKYNLRHLGLATLSGVLLTLGFPNAPFTFLMFVGFVPLLKIIEEKRTSTESVPIQSAGGSIMPYAYHTFVLWNIGTTWWVGNAGLLPGMIANFLNAFFMALVVWLFDKISRSWLNSRFDTFTFRAVVFSMFWMGFEYLHLNWEISWSWLTLGNAFAQYPSWVQWYAYTGVFGGSLWILSANFLILNTINNFNKNNKIAALARVVLLVATPLSISLILWVKKNVPSNNKTYSIAVVQPNYEPHYQKFDVPENIQLTKFLDLARRVVDSTTDYLVFPETSFDFHNYAFWREKPVVNALQDFVNQYPRLHLVTGVDALNLYAQYVKIRPAGLPETVRQYNNRDGTYTFFEVYNAATQLVAGDSSILPLYKKSKLVPGPEILPYKFLLSWLTPLFDKFGGTVGGLGMQTERSIFKNKDGQFAVAPVICYESVFGDYCRGYVQNGANALFVVTNDGWWDDTPGYQQHQKFASLRAIELHRPVIRSANTGSSCFIDVKGTIHSPTAYGEDAAIKATIPVYNDMTFYQKTGDVIGFISAYLSLGFMLNYLMQRIRSRFKA